MYRKVVPLIVACALMLSLGLAGAIAATAPASTEAAATEAGEAAAAYANALALGNADRAWTLLSSESKQGVAKEQFASSLEAPRSSPKPPASAALRALAAGPTSVGGVLVKGDTAYVQVKGNVQITQTVFLVKESGGWRVDLRATDEASSRDAAEQAMESVREDTASPAHGQRTDVSLPMLRAMLRPEVKNYQVVKASVTGDKAQVTVGADVPVSVVFQEVRSGPGWAVRSLASNVDILSEDPLQEAVRGSQLQACQDQLRQIGAAIQMYAASSDDMLPDPSRWVDQITPYLRQPGALHCALDSTPGISYAMNKNLAGKRRRDIGNPSLVPVVFESTLHAKNAADTGQSWPQTSWHEGGVLVLYADGSVRQAEQKPSFQIAPAPPGGMPQMRPGTARPGRPGMPGMPGAPGATPPGVMIRPQPQAK